MRRFVGLLCILGALSAPLWSAGGNPPTGNDSDGFADNRLLGRGINFGNALEAPTEGAWGLTLKAEHFEAIKRAGFKSVRIPIRWSAHGGEKPPYTIDPTFFQRIDWAVDQALAQKLAVVINVHHYEGMERDPNKHLPRLVGLWRQIAEHYRNQPRQVIFEILNEPNSKLTDERWQQAMPQVLAAIRESNPRRGVIIGPAGWNSIDHLGKLHLPEADRNLIATVHYYSPFHFTHQGAPWAKGSDKWKGTTWTNTPQEQAVLRKDFEKAAAWASKHKRPLFLGEFGAYSAAPMDSRAQWTTAVAREAERHGMSWAYWEFAAGFGAYNQETRTWRAPLLKALVEVDVLRPTK
jgi:endoglucanase